MIPGQRLRTDQPHDDTGSKDRIAREDDLSAMRGKPKIASHRILSRMPNAECRLRRFAPCQRNHPSLRPGPIPPPVHADGTPMAAPSIRLSDLVIGHASLVRSAMTHVKNSPVMSGRGFDASGLHRERPHFPRPGMARFQKQERGRARAPAPTRAHPRPPAPTRARTRGGAQSGLAFHSERPPFSKQSFCLCADIICTRPSNVTKSVELRA